MANPVSLDPFQNIVNVGWGDNSFYLAFNYLGDLSDFPPVGEGANVISNTYNFKLTHDKGSGKDFIFGPINLVNPNIFDFTDPVVPDPAKKARYKFPDLTTFHIEVSVHTLHNGNPVFPTGIKFGTASWNLTAYQNLTDFLSQENGIDVGISDTGGGAYSSEDYTFDKTGFWTRANYQNSTTPF